MFEWIAISSNFTEIVIKDYSKLGISKLPKNSKWNEAVASCSLQNSRGLPAEISVTKCLNSIDKWKWIVIVEISMCQPNCVLSTWLLDYV